MSRHTIATTGSIPSRRERKRKKRAAPRRPKERVVAIPVEQLESARGPNKRIFVGAVLWALAFIIVGAAVGWVEWYGWTVKWPYRGWAAIGYGCCLLGLLIGVGVKGRRRRMVGAASGELFTTRSAGDRRPGDNVPVAEPPAVEETPVVIEREPEDKPVVSFADEPDGDDELPEPLGVVGEQKVSLSLDEERVKELRRAIAEAFPDIGPDESE